MSAPNLIVTIATRYLEALACGSLDYRDGRNGHKSRAAAAAALWEQVHETRTPGVYYVVSEESSRRGYMVDAVGPDFGCECEDAAFSKNNGTGYCKHQIIAILYHTVKEVLAEVPDETEQEPVKRASKKVLASTDERR